MSGSQIGRAPRLGEQQRTRLNKVVSEVRRILETDLAEQLEGRYGIRADGVREDAAALRLDSDQRLLRSDLLDILDHFTTEGSPGRDGVARLRREAVFTHTNRLVAIRIAEELGLLPETLARGKESGGFRDLIRDAAPLLADDEHGGYWRYLSLCGDELAHDVPRLFDPRNPLLGLNPQPAALDRLIALLAPAYVEGGNGALWAAADTLGWAYQFFNQKEERDEMRASSAPRNSRELAVRNQFFTPEYVVSYLVENTLGRLLVAGRPSGILADGLAWLTDAPEPRGEPLVPLDAKVLDPACGSGHFLLGAYDVLERAWVAEGTTAAEAAPRILASLWGIDIDPRAAQVAAAALMFRARRVAPSADLPTPQAICARSVPPVPSDLRATLSPDAAHLLDDLTAAMNDAQAGVGLLGPLLEIEERLGLDVGGTEIARTFTTVGARSREEVTLLLDEVDDIVHRAADGAGSSPAERLTAAEAGDAVRFVRAMANRYDVVLMNPPFGEPVPSTKEMIKRVYPWIPTKDHNLLAAFVGRGIRLCKPGGMVGAITSRAGLFLTTFEGWRREVLFANHLVGLADLGFPVMEQAMVEGAAYIVARGKPIAPAPATCLRLLREGKDDKPPVLAALAQAARRGEQDSRIFHVDPDDLADLPGQPVAYWVPEPVRHLFRDLPALEGHGAEIRVGLQTGDDFRFLRAAWEIDPAKVATTRAETFAGKRWVPFAKGGEYAPFWSDVHLVVDYAKDGEALRAFPGSVIRNKQYYFRPGLTWPPRTQGGFNPSILPEGSAFGHKGPAIFVLEPQSAISLLALLLSRPGIGILDLIATFGSYEVGAVGRLPLSLGASFLHSSVSDLVRDMVSFHRRGDMVLEPSRIFIGPPLSGGLGRSQIVAADFLDQACTLLARWSDAEQAILEGLGLDSSILDWLDEYVGTLDPIRHIPTTRPPRWVCAELEALARSSHLSYLDAAAALLSNSARQTSRFEAEASGIASYLVGCAFGRWDVRVGADPDLAPLLGDLFDPLPVCPPGMLVGSDGLPASQAPADYPLELPLNGLLLDQPGHRLDIVDRLRAAAEALGLSHGNLDEIWTCLGGDARTYLRKAFWKQHLGRYSKSRRKAPLYWPLSTTSRGWTAWVYAPRFTRETLFAVEAAAEARLSKAIEDVRRLEADQLAAGGTTTREQAQLLDIGRRLADELRVFQTEARRVAELGWVPDLDDGIVLNAAPLADLFPDWRTELVAQRRAIKKGTFDDWAQVARWKDSL